MPGSPQFNQPPYVRYSLSRRHTPAWQNSDMAIEDYCWPLIKHLYPKLEKSHVVDVVDHTSDSLIYIPVGYVNQMAEFFVSNVKTHGFLFGRRICFGCTYRSRLRQRPFCRQRYHSHWL